ncbi:alpha/beta hydrolase [Nostoc sp. CENA67]|uniref:Alpha/beta hydrolase n=1 Tax=Amazonocrinis nigriterrae CENA67 TaxID=2794033 RepID=A0A8J7HT43_9NOST|nr:alpha/beta hydrolase [Amazonocrinis nigriterrae]MBH8565212.1 alpha/beta hydrolase [Amazonocrinis nigriterrae CENA67]
MFATLIDTALPTLRSSSIIYSPASRSRSNIQFMDMGITWIRYCITGDNKPTIVLNTDPPLTIESYEQTITELSRYFRVIVFEIPGFGFSFPKRLSFRYDFDFITTILVQFLTRLNLGPYVLSFPCLLGFCAIKIANLHPELVSHMVLNQIPTWQGALEWKKGRDPQGILSTPFLGQIALHFLKQKRCGSWFDLVSAESQTAQKLTEIALSSYKLGACFSLASCFQFYLQEQQPDLEPVKQPSLIIWGECDGSHAHTDKSQTRQLTLDYEEIYIQKAGHSPEVEAPQIFAESVKNLVG